MEEEEEEEEFITSGNALAWGKRGVGEEEESNLINLKEVSLARCRVAPARASPLTSESPPPHENCS